MGLWYHVNHLVICLLVSVKMEDTTHFLDRLLHSADGEGTVELHVASVALGWVVGFSWKRRPIAFLIIGN